MLEKLKTLAHEHKVALALSIVGVVGVVLYLRWQSSQSALGAATVAGPTGETTGSSGLLNGAYDIFGNPLLGNQTPTDSGQVPATVSDAMLAPTPAPSAAPAGGNSGIPTGDQPPAILPGGTPPAPSSGTPWTGTTITALVRPTQKGDPSSQGVPLRASADPKSAVLIRLPFNSTQTVTGKPIAGPASVSNGPKLWYPVSSGGKTGFVNAFDFAKVG